MIFNKTQRRILLNLLNACDPRLEAPSEVAYARAVSALFKGGFIIYTRDSIAIAPSARKAVADLKE